MKSMIVRCTLAVLFSWAAAGNAAASLIFEINPISSSVAEITATGDLDVSPLASSISLNGATTTGNNGLADSFTGNFTLVGQTPDFVFVRSGTPNLVIHFPSLLSIGDAPAGTMTVTLDVETFLSIGTMGNVTVDGRPDTILGTFSVQPASTVPEPATLALLGVGLAGIGFARHRARSTH